MRWSDVRENYKNKWIVFESLKAKSEDGKRIVEDLAVIDLKHMVIKGGNER